MHVRASQIVGLSPSLPPSEFGGTYRGYQVKEYEETEPRGKTAAKRTLPSAWPTRLAQAPSFFAPSPEQARGHTHTARALVAHEHVGLEIARCRRCRYDASLVSVLSVCVFLSVCLPVSCVSVYPHLTVVHHGGKATPSVVNA